MMYKLSAEEDYVGSDPHDREEGRRALSQLRLAADKEDQLAEAFLRAHALHLGRPGITSLSMIPVKSLDQTWVHLKSEMDRHSGQYYSLPLPNIWINLNPSWHRRLCRLLSDDAYAKDIFEKWGIYSITRQRNHGQWLLRVLEATLLDPAYASLLLIGIANFRCDAALPALISTDGPFLSVLRAGKVSRSKPNVLRSALRSRRRFPGDKSVHIPAFETLAQLDEPISRLVSLLLSSRLDEPGSDKRRMLREERYSRAQEEILRAIENEAPLALTPVLRQAWTTLRDRWPNLTQHFSKDEAAILEKMIDLPLITVFPKHPRTNAGVFNLIPPSVALASYQRPADLEFCSVKEAVLWGYLTLLCRCGCRASDLYRINAKSFNGIGLPEMCVTLPFTKMTNRRTLPVGAAMPEAELLQFSRMLKLLGSSSLADEPWFSIITGKNVLLRWQYDFAYTDFRSAIAPPEVEYLPTHIPRHAFATSFGLHFSGQLLGRLDHPFFRQWTQDPCVQAISHSAIPSLHASLHDSLLLANQLMGHQTTAQFIRTYCHAWPLILAAAAEVRRPKRLPWDRLESALIQKLVKGSGEIFHSVIGM